MMVDSDLGAQLTTMFMVQYDPDGVAGKHDHPFEEILLPRRAGRAIRSTARPASTGPGDVAWAGVGCVHSFRNIGGGPLRWLETQAPQPHGGTRIASPATGSTWRRQFMTELVVIGGTSGIGREIASRATAGRLGGDLGAGRRAERWSPPRSGAPPADRRRPVRSARPRLTTRRDRAVVVAFSAIHHDQNTVADYQIDGGQRPRRAQARRVHRGDPPDAAEDAR